MRRIYPLFALVLAAGLAACGQNSRKSGPVVAKGDGIVITAGEFKARIERLSPFIRARFNTLERKKELLDNLIKEELLAKEAEKQGLDKDPDVQLMMRQAMVQKLVQKTFAEGDASKEISDAEARKFYDDHKDDFVKPRKIRLAHILLAAPGGPSRAQKAAQAKKVLARAQAEEKKNSLAFAGLARELSEDQTTKNAGGDLGFRSQAELERQYGKPFADRAFGLTSGGLAVLESPQGFHVVKLTGTQEAIDRPFETVKSQIQARLYRERRAKNFEDFVKKLRDEARVTVNDAELDKVAVAGGPGAAPGAMVPGMGARPLLAPPAHPVVTPAPPPGAAPASPQRPVSPAPPPGAAPPPAPAR